MGVISSEKYTHTLKSLANPRVVAVFSLRFSSRAALGAVGRNLAGLVDGGRGRLCLSTILTN